MATFRPKSLLAPPFPEQRSAGSEDHGRRSEEKEAPAEARGARDTSDQGRANQESEVAEDRHRRERGPPAALPAEAPRQVGADRAKPPPAITNPVSATRAWWAVAASVTPTAAARPAKSIREATEGPRTPVQPEDREGRGQAFRSTQSSEALLAVPPWTQQSCARSPSNYGAAKAADTDRRGCAPAVFGGPRGSHARGRRRRPQSPRGRVATRARSTRDRRGR